MLMAHPAILRNLVEQYETLKALHAEVGSSGTRRRLEDITYTLCVSTGTRTPTEALAAAEQRLNSSLPSPTEAVVPLAPATAPGI
ncbi:DUF5133 domain-containing protein [Streptomyces sp. NPDC050804]|uniref:DUF5133 domain-containing protein n=1 Tax=Streptomyces sp. NPDC050804 TaxID=3154745 RepID=UPI00344ABD85